MKCKTIKLRFLSSVHFGDGGLTRTQGILKADTFFSAMCTEAVRRGDAVLEQLLDAVRDHSLRLTDGLPYIQDRYYIPKPLLEIRGEKTGDSGTKKAIKKLAYIPVTELDTYLAGRMDFAGEAKWFHDHFGRSSLMEKVKIERDKDSMPYAVEIFTYAQESGLCFLISYENEQDLELVLQLVRALGYEGIGGKRTAGYGRFEITVQETGPAFMERLVLDRYQACMTLSGVLPREDCMEAAMDGGSYLVEKRSGFVSSVNYAPEFRKKRPLYVCKAGAVFTEPFEGDLYDVSDGGTHPVYRYAMPFWLGVS